jgi:hypothetical protein
MRSLALLALAACESTTGTVRLELATAPGSTVMDSVSTLRLTLTNPHQVDEVERDAGGGFDLALSFEAAGEFGALVVEGFDTAGALVATGASPAFSLGPTNAHVVIYVAAPMSIAAAPVSLGPPHDGVSGVALPYGALFAGGRDAAGAASDAIAIYNVFDHSLVGGQPMPLKRSSVTLAANTSGLVYVLGGTDEAGGDAATLLAFNTTVAPAGFWISLGEQPSFARAGEAAVPIGPDRFLVTGAPPGELSGGELAARTDLAVLPRAGASVFATDGARTALFASDAGLIRFRDDRFEMLASTGTAVAALPATGKFVVVRMGVDALLVDAATGTIESHPGVFTVPRSSAALAATDRYLVAAGNGSADILDVQTLARVATVPVAQRTGAQAFALANGQVLIAGGSPANDLIELFTPPPAE